LTRGIFFLDVFNQAGSLMDPRIGHLIDLRIFLSFMIGIGFFTDWRKKRTFMGRTFKFASLNHLTYQDQTLIEIVKEIL
jgi:hypothetical protein